MKIVLRIGGSVLGSPPKPLLITSYSEVVRQIIKDGHSIGIVVGGGKISREYIESAKEIGLSELYQDLIAIHASRLNARLIAMKVSGVNFVPTTIASMLKQLREHKVAVMGGLRPGITTDTVAAILAQKWGADLMIKGSNQQGVYTADPTIDKDAKKLDYLTYSMMKDILGGKHEPGIHSIIDPIAVEYLSKNRIKLIVLDGRDPMNVVKAIRGERIGTLVS